MKKITVIRIKPYMMPELIEIDNTLEAMQKEVGGYIQAVYPWEDPVAIICDEEGKIKRKPFNIELTDDDGNVYDIIVGTLLIVGLDEEGFTDIGEYKEKYYNMFDE